MHRHRADVSSRANHTMGPDYVLLGYASPRQLYYMAKAEIFRVHPIMSGILYKAGVFPVKRGKSDAAALDQAIDLLQQGRMLGMFPEGTRSRSGILRTGKTGTARISIKAGVPVVPAVVIRSEEIYRHLQLRTWRRPHVIVRFGPPLCWHGANDEDTAPKAFTDEIMAAIAALLPPHLRGDYIQSSAAPVDSVLK